MANIEDIHLLLGNNTIFLTGFMGSGKTTVGYHLSQILDVPFYDIDSLIEEQQGLMVMDIFANDGEGTFRELETQILEIILEEPGPNVVALGGGTLEREANRAMMRTHGILIGLNTNPENLIPRLDEGQLATLMMMTNRPIYDSLFTDNIAMAIDELYKRRKHLYDDVDISVKSDEKSLEEIIDEILFQISNKLLN